MVKVYMVIFLSYVTAAAYGQSFERIVFNSTGALISTGGVSMTLSVGEPVTGVSETPSVALGQGFLPGTKTIVAVPSGIIDEQTASTAGVYPNPFSGQVWIGTSADDVHVYVSNTMGQQVYEGMYQGGGIDLSGLAPGIYMIRAISNEQIITNTKLLKL